MARKAEKSKKIDIMLNFIYFTIICLEMSGTGKDNPKNDFPPAFVTL